MKTITCFDVFENPHELPESEVSSRVSVYAVVIHDNKILLTKDAWAKQWEFPGGGVDEGEEEGEGLKREVWEETGLQLGEIGEVVESIQTNFYMISEKKGYNSLRKFYKAQLLISGELLTEGNGSDTLAATFMSLKEIERLTDQEMKPIYKEVLKKALR